MVLVAYSDSEGSDSEKPSKPAVEAASKPIRNQTAGFAVNRSNSRKIQVSLGSSVVAPPENNDEPAPKRMKVGSGGLGGFNAMLPAPKRENEKKPAANGGARKVFSLKTGAEPGFSREADAELRQLFTEQDSTIQPNGGSTTRVIPDTASDTAKIDNPMRFKPLSVSRNTNKKKHIVPTQPRKSAASIGRIQGLGLASTSAAPYPTPPKISLFSAGHDAVATSTAFEKHDASDLDEITDQQTEDTNEHHDMPVNDSQGKSQTAAPSQGQSLDTIASDLNLSAADRRKLLGREGKGATSAINIVNFNTDQEYAANEVLRASGEQAQHNPVRGIAPGKHSLKQLVNAASTQKDALEESFAAGKSNKREAGSRYGW